LKRCYRRNLLLGQAAAAVFTLVMVICVQLASGSAPESIPEDNLPGSRLEQTPFERPGPVDPVHPGGDYAADRFMETIKKLGGTIVPVNTLEMDEDDSSVDYGFDDITGFESGFGADHNENFSVMGGSGSGEIPPPDSFIIVDMEPIAIELEQPAYPALAKASGLTATLWVQAYVDREGKVRKAMTANCSLAGFGFAENALAAAYNSVYRPAIRDGNPIGVWVTYKVKYALDDAE
jgi:hypothetical protein